MQALIHYFLHFIFPGVLAYGLYRNNWFKVYLVWLCTMLVDLDHLLATPVFEACRCSINFHPLHSCWAMGIYLVLLCFRNTRIIALGLLLHMGTDALDCVFSRLHCN